MFEVFAVASHSAEEADMFHARAGGILQADMERVLSGFLVRRDVVSFKVGAQSCVHAC